ncbi:MAG: hypothetical protein ACYSWS_08910 [Planctomycetota bacterium]|jgi:hypothetical protein
MTKDQIQFDVESSLSLPDNEAVDILWKAFTKTADLMKSFSVNERNCQITLKLVERLSEEEIKRLLKHVSIDSLVFLDPPLETILIDPEGTSVEDSTMRAIGKLRSSRDSDPGDAFTNLLVILEKIHAHGFNAGSESYDKEILSLTRKILYLLCLLAISKLN